MTILRALTRPRSLRWRGQRPQTVSPGASNRADEAGGLALANCPFHALAEAHRTLMCGVNIDLIDSLVQAAGPRDLRAELSPSPGMCCVRITKA